jgi:hypothetical protein
MAKVVGSWSLKPHALVQSQTSPHAIFGGQNGARISFFPSMSVSPVSIIPQIFHIHTSFNVSAI